MSIIFLDRDGVINENRSDYVKSWSEFRFLPGSCEAIGMLTRAGHRIVICTNQAAIARGYITVEAIHDIHRRMLVEIREFGGYVEKVYYCPHGKDEHCPCRKPRPGMLLQARDELGLNMNDAIFIGDSITDMQAAEAAGIRRIMVMTGLGAEQLTTYRHTSDHPFAVMQSLRHAVESMMMSEVSLF